MASLPASEGEVVVKPEHRFAGYLGDSQKTEKILTADGWIRTNDLGYLDNRDRLFVIGRRSDVIMRGAYIVIPQWLEARVRQCPGVKDVLVVPMPDEVNFNEICACVIRKEGSAVTEEDLDMHCSSLIFPGVGKEKQLKPKYFLFFDRFLLNSNMKTDRRKLAKIAAERLNLS